MKTEVEAKGLNYEFDSFRVDTSAFRLLKNDSPISIEPKALHLLSVLIENRGRLIEKQQILDTVWGDVSVSENALTREIAILRRALGDDTRQPRFIETVPTRGYRFIAKVRDLPHEASLQVDRIATPSSASAAIPVTEPRQKRHLRLWSALAIVIVALVGVLILKWRAVLQPKIESLAVLPFLSADHNSDLDYLGDGIAESVTNNLSQVPGLKVMSRHSAFRYRQADVRPGKVARELGVGALLMGSLREHGDNLRISVELIDGADEHQIWGEEYTRKFSSLNDLQSEIAYDVSQQLRLKLTPAVQSRIARRDTENSDAYRWYLLGRFALDKRNNEAIKDGLGDFRKAVALDRNYALPYTGLSASYGLLSFYGGMEPRTAFAYEAEAIHRALELDPELADAHVQRGFYLWFPKLDGAASEAEFRRAIELDPNSYDAHHAYVLLLIDEKRFDEAIAEGRKATALEPQWVGSYGTLADALVLAGRYDDALQVVQSVHDRFPNLEPEAHAYEGKKQFDRAIYAFQEEFRSWRTNYVEADLAHAYAGAGNRAEARRILNQLLGRRKTGYFSAYKIAIVYAGLGEDAQALRWLRTAADEEDPWLQRLDVDPDLEQYRGRQEIREVKRRLLENAKTFPD